MHLILHIGAEKTGTKSIQQALFQHEHALLRHSVLVPRSLRAWGHHAQLYSFFKGNAYSDDFFQLELKSSSPSSDSDSIVDRWKQAFETEIQASTAKQCIVTSEFLQSRLIDTEEIASLGEYLASHFESTHVVLYIRDQLEATCSLVSTALKGISGSYHSNHFPLPGTPEFEELGIDWKFDYKRVLESWTQVFGQSCLSVRLYDRTLLRGGCVVKDFFFLCGLENNNFNHCSHLNRSLGATGMALLSAFNKVTESDFKDHRWHEAKAFFAEVISVAFTNSRRYTPSSETQKRYTEFFSESNEWVRKNFFPERERLFGNGEPRAEVDAANSFEIDPADSLDIAIAFKLILSHMATQSPSLTTTQPAQTQRIF